MDDQTPRRIARRTRNRESRAAFKVARDRGLIRRHQLKLQHLAERQAVAERDALTDTDPIESESTE
jgi:hypothetical protein